MNPSSDADPWSRTLNMLLRFSEHTASERCNGATADPCSTRKSTKRRTRQCNDYPMRFSPAHIKVQVVERLTKTTISVTWHDPTSVNYTEQLWLLGSAHAAGICSLTGAPISRGQRVYRPRRNGRRPALNQDAMILSEMTSSACTKIAAMQEI
jgi:hypothetical protein